MQFLAADDFSRQCKPEDQKHTAKAYNLKHFRTNVKPHAENSLIQDALNAIHDLYADNENFRSSMENQWFKE
jgi:hypothetical protein